MEIPLGCISPRNSAQALLLHLHLKHKTTLTGGCVLVEMGGNEPPSESGCDCESTVRRAFFDLSSSPIEWTKQRGSDLLQARKSTTTT